jgi:hypothetical protein
MHYRFAFCLLFSIVCIGPGAFGQADSIESLRDTTRFIAVRPFKDTAALAAQSRVRLGNLLGDSTTTPPAPQVKAIPYYKAWQNPWYLYAPRYQQFVDILSPADLAASPCLALTHRPGNQPYEQGLVYFPGPTCVYLDGRFVAYLNKTTLDLNSLRPKFLSYAAFYFNPTYDELSENSNPKLAIAPIGGVPPYRHHRDALLAGSFTVLLALMLGAKGRAFYRVFSLGSLLLRPAQPMPGQGAEVLGWQTAVHFALSVLCTALFLFCYRFGTETSLLLQGAAVGWANLQAFGQIAVGIGMSLVALELYVYVIGLALFNIRSEGSHVRGNLEVFSIGSICLTLWALIWNFSDFVSFKTFQEVSFYFCLILFCIKGFLMYKILVSDQGFRKFYALSYICLTELLPSILLIRLLTDL